MTWRRPLAPIGSPLAIRPPSVLTGSRPPISSSPSPISRVLLAVLAEAALGEVHQLGAGLGVLQLGDIDLAGPDAGRLERGAGGVDGGALGDLRRQPRAEHLERPEPPGPELERPQLDRPVAETCRARSADISTTAAPPSLGLQNMYEVSGSLTIVAAAISSAGIGLAPPRVGCDRAVAERLGGELGEQAWRRGRGRAR